MAIVVVSGQARTGKDTLGRMIQDTMDDGYFIMAYATELKRKLVDDFGLNRDQLHGHLKEEPDERYPKKDGGYWTPREMLQHLGTDSYKAIDKLFWVKRLFKYVDRNNLENVIIIDGRFPEEIEAVKERGGYHIRIFRDVNTEIHGKDHMSETSLDDFPDADFVVNNNGTFDDLRRAAEAIKKEIKEVYKNGSKRL